MQVDARPKDTAERGVIDGGARILAELLRTPRWVKSARIVLGNVDAESAPAFVRTVLYADSMLTLDVLSAAPAVANAAALGSRELLEQLLSLPEELLHRLLPRLLKDLSAEPLGEAVGLALVAVGRLLERPHEALTASARTVENDFKRGLETGLARDEDAVPRQVAWLGSTILRLARENPQLMTKVVRPLGQAFAQALQEDGDG